MKKMLFVSIVLLLNVLTVSAQTGPMSDYEVTKTIEQTLQDIKDALKEIKPQFPQLANIDYAATVTRNPSGEEGTIRFEYSKGFVQGSYIPKDAASIFVEIKYPAALEDVRAPNRTANFLRWATVMSVFIGNRSRPRTANRDTLLKIKSMRSSF